LRRGDYTLFVRLGWKKRREGSEAAVDLYLGGFIVIDCTEALTVMM
jgi:hypothetical protein